MILHRLVGAKPLATRPSFSRHIGHRVAAAALLGCAGAGIPAYGVVVIEGDRGEFTRQAASPMPASAPPISRITGDAWSTRPPAAPDPIARTDAAGTSWSEGMERYREARAADDTPSAQQHYLLAAQAWRVAIKQGDSRAYAALGWLALRGLGQRVDLNEAARFARRAIASGDARGSCLLGMLNVESEYEAGARESWQAAALAGNAVAANELGIRAEQDGDLASAKRWYQQAATTNLDAATQNLGRLGAPTAAPALRGRFESLRTQAQEGDAVAMYSLGLMYHTGRGVAVDYTSALGWYRRSASRLYPRAQAMLAHIGALNDGDSVLSLRMRELAQTRALREFNLLAWQDEKPRHADLLTEETMQ